MNGQLQKVLGGATSSAFREYGPVHLIDWRSPIFIPEIDSEIGPTHVYGRPLVMETMVQRRKRGCRSYIPAAFLFLWTRDGPSWLMGQT